MLYSPLEQFELKIFGKLYIPYLFDISFTNACLYLCLAVSLIIAFLFFGIFRARIIPQGLQAICENLYLFIVDIIKQQAGPTAVKYIPLFFTIFLLVLASNLIGLLPFAFTPTSHLAITFTLALSCNLGLIIIGFHEHGFRFLKLFVPKGGPLWLLPLIVVIEFISYLLRTFSLSIRLFANMMAGHTLLHILASFVTGFISAGYTSLALFPFALVVAVVVLELGIAFLQAYVFIVLLSIYLNDSLHPSH
jgi:F-type H+-transporting ATPase subunit a